MANPWEQNWREIEDMPGGGQGKVKLVESKSTPGKRGVLKILKNKKSQEARGRMRREVIALQTLPTLGALVPQVYDQNSHDFGNPSIDLFLVMEQIVGATLSSYVTQRGPLPVDEATLLLRSLCETVNIGHKAGVLHRDLKPDNIIVHSPKTGVAYIVDYGLSFNVEDDELTQTDEIFKSKFLSLPAASIPGGNRRDPHLDIISLCGVYYFMLTGKEPGQLIDDTGRPPHFRPGHAIRDFVKDDSRLPLLDVFFSRGFAIQSQSRFQSPGELIDRLDSISARGTTRAQRNPSLTAAELSTRILEVDTKTKVATRKPGADALLEQLRDFANQRGKDLGQFRLRMNPGGQEGPKRTDIAMITRPFVVTLNIEHHDDLRRDRIYRIGLLGDQCVVMACDLKYVKGRDRTDTQFGKWEDLRLYSDPSEVFSALRDELDQWLDDRLNELGAALLSEFDRHE